MEVFSNVGKLLLSEDGISHSLVVFWWIFVKKMLVDHGSILMLQGWCSSRKYLKKKAFIAEIYWDALNILTYKIH